MGVRTCLWFYCGIGEIITVKHIYSIYSSLTIVQKSCSSRAPSVQCRGAGTGCLLSDDVKRKSADKLYSLCGRLTNYSFCGRPTSYSFVDVLPELWERWMYSPRASCVFYTGSRCSACSIIGSLVESVGVAYWIAERAVFAKGRVALMWGGEIVGRSTGVVMVKQRWTGSAYGWVIRQEGESCEVKRWSE
jgi:hypothetical protein